MCNFSQVEEESTQLKAKGSSDEQVAADNKENIPPSQAEVSITTNTKTHLNSTKNRHVLMPIKQPQARGTNQKTIKRKIKPSKGKSLMVVNPDRAITLPHKTKKGLVNSSFNLCPPVTKKTRTENRKVHCVPVMM
ncbi:protein TPX2-like [Raphanus sativus]|uniref:Protein TPX2-like n=1 Tax=Raphanus sativus TaxID=3726 RepID=A0A9W3DM81_RAPSA|nr:protein TPX2-like [Raphanus sativus]